MKILRIVLIVVVILHYNNMIAYCQQVITGKVESEYFGPIAGAVISVNDRSVAVRSNNLGEYSIEIDTTHYALTFNYFGHDELSVKIEKQNQIDVVLRESAIVIDEVIIEGASVIEKMIFVTKRDTVFNKRNRVKLIRIGPSLDTLQMRIEYEKRKKIIDEIYTREHNLSINNDLSVNNNSWDIENIFRHYLVSTITYPESALNVGIQGIVTVSFIVDEFGKIKDIEVVHGPDDSLYEVVVSAIQQTPEDIVLRMTRKMRFPESKSFPVRYLMRVRFNSINY